MTNNAGNRTKGLSQAESAEARPEAGAKDTTETTGEAAELVDLPAKHILVAEDYHLNQKLISAMLSNLGHRISLANNGLEAVSAVLRFPYDLILMDVHMPELDGKAAARRIRGLPRPEGDIPIIALTADASMDQKQQCLDAGMNDYLTKPIVLPDLLRSMARCLATEQLPERDTTTQPTIAKSESGFDAEATSAPIIDADLLFEFAAIVGWDTFAKLFETLEKDFAEHRKIITRAAENNEIVVLRAQIQALNGALGQFGATKAQETAHVIETLCKADYSENASGMVPRFLQLCNDSISDLHQFLITNAPEYKRSARSS